MGFLYLVHFFSLLFVLFYLLSLLRTLITSSATAATTTRDETRYSRVGFDWPPTYFFIWLIAILCYIIFIGKWLKDITYVLKFRPKHMCHDHDSLWKNEFLVATIKMMSYRFRHIRKHSFMPVNHISYLYLSISNACIMSLKEYFLWHKVTGC